MSPFGCRRFLSFHVLTNWETTTVPYLYYRSFSLYNCKTLLTFAHFSIKFIESRFNKFPTLGRWLSTPSYFWHIYKKVNLWVISSQSVQISPVDNSVRPEAWRRSLLLEASDFGRMRCKPEVAYCTFEVFCNLLRINDFSRCLVAEVNFFIHLH